VHLKPFLMSFRLRAIIFFIGSSIDISGVNHGDMDTVDSFPVL
jgi:hypothetical protein